MGATNDGFCTLFDFRLSENYKNKNKLTILIG